MSLPRWMRRAIKDQVLNQAEAQEIYQLCLNSPSEEVEMPKHLTPALERVWLWEMQTEPTHH